MTRPFSAGERALHRLLERAGITEWIANPRLRVGSETLFPDTYFPDSRLVVEFDGRKFHGPEQFERDRERQNLLVSHGYTVLRFTWAIITTRPHEVIALIRRTLRLLQAA